MSSNSGSTSESDLGASEGAQKPDEATPESICPVCGAKLVSEKCKVVCRSERCRYRIVFNCAEF